MFGRFFLLILSVASLAWIVYAGAMLLDKKNLIQPQSVFSNDDGQILIVNRSNEVDFDQLTFSARPNTERFVKHLCKHVYLNERLFVSEKKDVILVEIPNTWNEELVKHYFKVKDMPVSKSGDVLKLDNGFNIQYKNNYLLLSKGEIALVSSDKKWPTWDTKAAACVIQLKNPLKSTNVYFRENGTISFQTKYHEELHVNKVDDIDLFAQFMTDICENYHFFEKEYALKNNELSAKSPMYQWMENGYVVFNVQGSTCIMSDFNKSIDPYQMLLSDEKAETQQLSNHFKGIALTASFPKDLETGFYIGRVGDKVLVSEKKELIDKLSADYQLGNTLALNPERFAYFFQDMPRKVSERQTDAYQKQTTSAFKNLLIKTLKRGEQVANDTQLAEKDNASFKMSDKPSYILGNGRTVFVFGEKNEIMALSNKKQLWKVRLDGNFVGRAKLLDMNENGNQQILVNTTTKMYVINTSNGANVNEFPLAVHNQSGANFYRWNTQTYLLTVNTSNELLQVGQTGRVVRKAKLKSSSFKDDVTIVKDGSRLVACVVGAQTECFELGKLKSVKAKQQLSSDFLALKSPEGYAYAYNGEGEAYGVFAGSRRSLGSSFDYFKPIYVGKNLQLLTINGSDVKAYNPNFTVGYQVKAPFSDVVDADFIQLPANRTYFAVLDEIESNIHILDANGSPVYDEVFEGSEMVKLSTFRNKLVITTVIGNSVVQHYVDIK